jgi:ferredoxin-nitrate reductase
MKNSRDSIENVWGDRTPYEGEWPERQDFRLEEQTPDKWVQSACVLCSNGCGVDIGVKNGKIVGVRGRTEDRVNRGRLGPKGLHGWVANASKQRLTTPLIRRNGQLEPASWDEAMSLIVQRSKEICDQYTANAIGFYTSGQLFLEEYYTLAVIGKAGLGTPHMDGNTRLCTATAAAALKETFGSDGQPGSYTDLDTTEAILHVGHNISNTQTVLWMRILDRRRGPNPLKLIVIDPRRTATAAEADIHLAPRAGTNVALLKRLLT